MRDVLRSQAWALYVALIVLASTASMAAWSPSARSATSWEGHPAHRAVWRVIDENRKYQASAFAVGPRLVVTVAHYLLDVLKAGSKEMELVQAGRDSHIEVVKARSISATHDIALLETATPMEHHLTVANALPHGLADQFRGAGYPEQVRAVRAWRWEANGIRAYFRDRTLRRDARLCEGGQLSAAPVTAAKRAIQMPIETCKSPTHPTSPASPRLDGVIGKVSVTGGGLDLGCAPEVCRSRASRPRRRSRR